MAVVADAHSGRPDGGQRHILASEHAGGRRASARLSLFTSTSSDMFIVMSIGGPRLLRAVGAPLGLYFRVGRDHKSLQALLAQNRANFSGVVLDPWDGDRHGELRRACAGRFETVLDTRALELSGSGSLNNAKITGLPWAGGSLPHTPALVAGAHGRQMAELIADEIIAYGYSAVLAPTRLISAPDDPWLAVDINQARWLRQALDQRGLSNTLIYFPLTLRSAVFGSSSARQSIIAALNAAPIDALWLRVQPFSAATLGPLALRRYIEASQDFQRLGLPVVGEKTGTAGVALMAFGAVGGIESGVTFGERFEINDLYKPPPPGGGGFVPSPRVYVQSLGVFMVRADYQALIGQSGMRSLFGCRDTSCCARGPADTDRDPRRHFLLQRQREINDISQRPEPVRPGRYLEEFLRPASDRALRAAKVAPGLRKSQQRLEHWRLTLGALNEQGPVSSVALAPEGKRLHPQLRQNA